MVRTAALILALVVSAPAIAAEQFDLVCLVDNPKKKAVPFSIRVDLVGGEWCIGKCEAVLKISSVTTSRIVFYEKDHPKDGVSGAVVDRLTGRYYFYQQGAGNQRYRAWTQRGNCEPAAFSGFGGGKVKF